MICGNVKVRDRNNKSHKFWVEYIYLYIYIYIKKVVTITFTKVTNDKFLFSSFVAKITTIDSCEFILKEKKNANFYSNFAIEKNSSANDRKIISITKKKKNSNHWFVLLFQK